MNLKEGDHRYQQQPLPGRPKAAIMVQQQQPAWSGPRSLIIPRSDDGFGFTLRQLVTESPLKREADAYSLPMESFHVSSVKKGSNAELAGLQAGDRIISVDGQSTTGRTFAEIVQQMQSNYGNMQLVVVPKDEDVVQLVLGMAMSGGPSRGGGVGGGSSSSGGGGTAAAISAVTSPPPLVSRTKGNQSVYRRGAVRERWRERASRGRQLAVARSRSSSSGGGSRLSDGSLPEAAAAAAAAGTAGAAPSQALQTLSARESQAAGAADVTGPNRVQLSIGDGASSAASRYSAGSDPQPPGTWGIRRDSHSSAGNYVQLSAAAQSPASLGPWPHDVQGSHHLHLNNAHGSPQPPQLQQRVQHRIAEPYSVPSRTSRALAYSGQQQQPVWQLQQQHQMHGQPHNVAGQALHMHSDYHHQPQQSQLQVVRATVTSVVTGGDSRSVAASAAAGMPDADRLISTASTTAGRTVVSAVPPPPVGPVLSYQLSAPRLPQQVIRAPGHLTGSGQTGRQASSVDGVNMASLPSQQQQQPQVSTVRYLPAYDGGSSTPPAAFAYRTPGAGVSGDKRPVSTFESAASCQVLQQQPHASQGSGRWTTAATSNVPGADRRGSWYVAPLRAELRQQQQHAVHTTGAAVGGGGGPPPSPVQQETTFDPRGIVEQHYVVYEPGAHGTSGQRLAAADDRGSPATAELRWRVSSDNDLLSTHRYSAMQADLQLPAAAASPFAPHFRLGSAPSAESLSQQLPASAALKTVSSLGSMQQLLQQSDRAVQGRPQMGVGSGAARTAYPAAAAALQLGGGTGSGGHRDRLPSDAPGMTYNPGFVFGPAAAVAHRQDSNVIGSIGGDPQRLFAASTTTRMRPMSYTPASGNMFALLEQDTTDHATSMLMESPSLELGGPLLPLSSGGSSDAQTGDEQLLELQRGDRSRPGMNRSLSSDDGNPAQIIRRTSYMRATAAPPKQLDVANDGSTSAVVRRLAVRPDFLGDPSVMKYPVYELQLGRDGGADTAGEGIAQPPITVGAPRFDLHSPTEGTLPSPLPPSPLPITREGNLAVKVEKIDGKKSSDRSWKVLGVVLCGRLLYFIKERKENIVLNQASDDIPVNLRGCKVDVAYGYTKKKNVFRLETASFSEYLFQADDQEDMLAWIRAILLGSDADKTKATSNAELIVRHIEQKLLSQSPVLSAGANKSGGGSGTAVKRLAVLPFWNRQQSPGSDSSSSGSKKERKAAKLLRGTSSPASLSAAGASEDDGASSGSTRLFGIPLSECPPSNDNEFIPSVVVQCTKAIEERGLEFTGLYRIPGNSVAVGVLQDELNSGIIDNENERWRDVNVVGSLLKLFFRKLPEPLVTAALYKSFIEANRIEKYEDRMNRLKQLIHELPEHNFQTFKYLADHLKRIANLGHINKMDAHNLAIVFGPTLLRPADDSMLSFVADMAGQCGVIETVITHNEWMFSAIGEPPPEPKTDTQSSSSSAPISETMQSIGEDIVRIAGKQQQQSGEPTVAGGGGKREHIASSITAAATRFLRSERWREKTKQPNSTTGATAVTASRAHARGQHGTGGGQTSSSSSDNGDHGFAERNIDEEVAARRRRLRDHEAKQMQQLYGDLAGRPRNSPAGAAGWRHSAVLSAAEPLRSRAHRPAAVGSASEDPELLYSAAASRLAEKPVSRWHSEESVLDQLHHHHHHYHDGSCSDGLQQVPSSSEQPSSPPLSWQLQRPRGMQQQQLEPQRDGSFNGIRENASGSSTAPSPPPPPLPARRYRSSSQEDTLVSFDADYGGPIYQGYFLASGGQGAVQRQQQPTAVASAATAASPARLTRQDWPSAKIDVPAQPSSIARGAGADISSGRGDGTAGSALLSAPNYQNVFAQALAAGDFAVDARRARAHQLHSGESAGERYAQSRSATLSSAAAGALSQQQQQPAEQQRRTPSVDSTFSGSDHSSDLLAAITSTFDQKLQRLLLRDDGSSAEADGSSDAGGGSRPAAGLGGSGSAVREPPAGRTAASVASSGPAQQYSYSVAGPAAATAAAAAAVPSEGSAKAAVAATGAAAGLQHSFRDPSLNKSAPIASHSVGTTGAKLDQLQQQASEQPPTPTTKIGIASRFERTDMKPVQPTAALPSAIINGIGSPSTTLTAVVASPLRWTQTSSGQLRQVRSSSYDSLADAEPSYTTTCTAYKRGGGVGGSSTALAKDAVASLGSREGVVRSFVDKFEQKKTQQSISAGVPGSTIHGSCSVSNLTSLTGLGGGGSRDAEVPSVRRRPGAGSVGKKRSYRRHTIGGDQADDYVDVAAAVVAAAEATSKTSPHQQTSAWDRLQPMVRQYEGAALRSVQDWIASERERIRGSFPDIYGLHVAADSSRRPPVSNRMSGVLPNRQT